MTDYGDKKDGVFHPAAPSLEDLLSKAGMQSWSGLEASPANADLAQQFKTADEAIKRAAFNLSRTSDGKIVLDFLIRETLRRSPYKFAKGQSMEQTVPYVIERGGQNATTIFLLNMIVEGGALIEREKKAAKQQKK